MPPISSWPSSPMRARSWRSPDPTGVRRPRGVPAKRGVWAHRYAGGPTSRMRGGAATRGGGSRRRTVPGLSPAQNKRAPSGARPRQCGRDGLRTIASVSAAKLRASRGRAGLFGEWMVRESVLGRCVCGGPATGHRRRRLCAPTEPSTSVIEPLAPDRRIPSSSTHRSGIRFSNLSNKALRPRDPAHGFC
jgi:hypothetical protein